MATQKAQPRRNTSTTRRSKPMTPRAGTDAKTRTTYSKGGRCGK